MFFYDSDRQLMKEILTEVQNLKTQGVSIMALAQDILDGVAAEKTSVDSLIALVNGWIANNTVTPKQGAAILSAINDNKAEIDAALAANVPPAPQKKH